MFSGRTGTSGFLPERELDAVDCLLLFLRGLFTDSIYRFFEKSTILCIISNSLFKQKQNHTFNAIGSKTEVFHKPYSTVIDFKHDVPVEILVLITGDECAAVAGIHDDGPQTGISFCILLKHFPYNKTIVPKALNEIARSAYFVFADAFFDLIVHLIRQGTT